MLMKIIWKLSKNIRDKNREAVFIVPDHMLYINLKLGTLSLWSTYQSDFFDRNSLIQNDAVTKVGP